jgi:hypothetical protein
MCREALHGDLITRPRLSRIYHRNLSFCTRWKPCAAGSAISMRSLRRCIPRTTWKPGSPNRFGRRLFEIFFKTYTEKVWGMSCTQVRAGWAAQRIKDLSLKSLLLNAIQPKAATVDKQNVIKTLIHEFQYLRRGPGMMWSRTREIGRAWLRGAIRRARGEDLLGAGARHRRPRRRHTISRSHFVSSMPVRDLLRALDPAPPADVLRAADDFHYRDFLTVVLIVRRPNLFPDNGFTSTPLKSRSAASRTRQLEPGDGARPRDLQPGPGVLLLRRRRGVDHGRPRPDRAR